MPNTPNFGWNVPTIGADLDVWGNELNAAFDLVDAEMFLKVNKANPVFTGIITAGAGGVASPIYHGSPKVVIHPTADSVDAIQFQDASGATIAAVDTIAKQLVVGGFGLNASQYQGNPIILRPIADGAQAIRFQNAAGSTGGFFDSLLSRLETLGSIKTPLYTGSPVVMRPVADGAAAFQVQNVAGVAQLQVNTSSGALTVSGAITTAVGQLWGVGTSLAYLVTGNATQGHIWYNASTTVVASLDTANGRMAIGPNPAVAGAKLDLQGVDGGLVLNRLTTGQRTGLACPAGTLVYDTDLNKMYIGTATGWQQVTSA